MSANRLTDGKVVYLDKDGCWTEHLNFAKLYLGKDELEMAVEKAKQSVRENLIVDPSPISLKPDEPSAAPVSLRDSIRAHGPTIEFGPKPVLQPN